MSRGLVAQLGGILFVVVIVAVGVGEMIVGAGLSGVSLSSCFCNGCACFYSVFFPVSVSVWKRIGCGSWLRICWFWTMLGLRLALRVVPDN